jgi:NADH:ubiquinone oxidoreductase subunit 2 (subunit N)
MTDSRSGPRRMRDRILGDEETARSERGYRLVMNSVYVVGVLFVIALIGMGVIAGFGAKSGVVSAMLTAVTGVIGSLVGAYFGIQVGTQGRQQVEDRAESRAERIESRAERARAEAEAVARRALAAVPPEAAAAVLRGDTPLPGGSPGEGETPAG